MSIQPGTSTFHQKAADHGFEVIKYLMSLFTLSVTIYIALFATYLSYSTSTAFVGEKADVIKVFMNSVSVGLLILIWFFRYVVRRVVSEHHHHLLALLPEGAENEKTRIAEVKDFLLAIGTFVASIGTVTIFALVFVIQKL